MLKMLAFHRKIDGASTFTALTPMPLAPLSAFLSGSFPLSGKYVADQTRKRQKKAIV